MIKVNLLKNRGGGTSSSKTNATSSDVSFKTSYDTQFGDKVSGASKGIATKILLIVLGVGGLIGYESYHIGDLKLQVAEFTRQNQTLTDEIAAKKPEADKAKVLQKEINDIDSRLQSMKGLSRIRLREIKAIDYLQNVIPERVWLTVIDFDETSINLEGGAISEDQLNRLIEAMEGKSIFHNVILLRSVEQKTKEGTVKLFQISSSLSGSD